MGENRKSASSGSTIEALPADNLPAIHPAGYPESQSASSGEIRKLVLEFVRRSLSENTREAYGRILRQFLLAIPVNPFQVRPEHIIAWRDELIEKKQKPNTVSLKLSVIRSFYDYLVVGGLLSRNPALAKLVPSPEIPEDMAGRALTPVEALRLLASPDRSRPEGARDYALLLIMLRMSLRVSEVSSLRVSSIHWTSGRWTIRIRVKGGRERTLPLPEDIHQAIKEAIRLDGDRRRIQHTDGVTAFVFQPFVNYRTGIYDRPLGIRMIRKIVAKYGDYAGLGDLSPHDLRRTAITQALDQGLSYRNVQMMSGHRDPKTVQRYDHGRENLDHNAVNFLTYEK